MILEDFISFGRTVPEKSQRYGKKVCMAGYSPECRALFRVYPLPINFNLPCRSMVSIHLERNKMDSRKESWAVKGRDPSAVINQVADRVSEKDLIEYLKSEVVESVDWLNEHRRSLGVLKVKHYQSALKNRKSVTNPFQLRLFDDFKEQFNFKTATDYFLAPYLHFTDTSDRKLQIRDWGLYELMRKYENQNRALTSTDISNGLNLSDDRDIYLVVGNMNHVRTSWIIIKTFSFKRERQLSLKWEAYAEKNS